MVEGMNIQDSEIVNILESIISRKLWDKNNWDLILSRSELFESNGINGVKFYCSGVDILLQPDGSVYDAHPHA